MIVAAVCLSEGLTLVTDNQKDFAMPRTHASSAAVSATNDRRADTLPAPAVTPGTFPVPAIIADAGDKASEHFLEFFAATIRNKNTGAADVAGDCPVLPLM